MSTAWTLVLNDDGPLYISTEKLLSPVQMQVAKRELKAWMATPEAAALIADCQARGLSRAPIDLNAVVADATQPTVHRGAGTDADATQGMRRGPA